MPKRKRAVLASAANGGGYNLALQPLEKRKKTRRRLMKADILADKENIDPMPGSHTQVITDREKTIEEAPKSFQSRFQTIVLKGSLSASSEPIPHRLIEFSEGWQTFCKNVAWATCQVFEQNARASNAHLTPKFLETACREQGVEVLYLPKFHCELNPIEQCWGYAKRVYRLNPPSSREDRLQQNALDALESVPLKSMRKFAVRSRRFMDAYEAGLNGRQAAWAARKYRGHRVLPLGIMEELGKMGVV